MFPMTVTINDNNQLQAVMAVLGANALGNEKSAKATVAKTGAISKPETTSKPADAAAQTPASNAAATATGAESVTQMSAAAAEKALEGQADKPATPTYQETASHITKLVQAKGKDAAIAVLAKFGAAKLPDVKPEQFAAVIAACEEAEA